MSTEETRTPEQEIEHLRTLNHRLSMQLVGMGDRLQESAKSIAADAWDAGFGAGWDEARNPGQFVNDAWDATTPNPYREDAK